MTTKYNRNSLKEYFDMRTVIMYHAYNIITVIRIKRKYYRQAMQLIDQKKRKEKNENIINGKQ